MPLPNATLDARVTTLMTTVRDAVTTRQAGYFARRGRYWQGRVTHALIPADPNPNDTLADIPPDPAVPLDHPTDQEETWGAMTTSDGFAWPGFTLPAKMPVRVRCDVYHGPSGDGYTVTAQVRLGLAVWTRVWHVGPETWRAVAWTSMEVA